MKNILLATLAALISPIALADGFICQSFDSNVRLVVKNSEIIVSTKPVNNFGRVSIVKFEDSILSNVDGGTAIEAFVDLRNKDFIRRGEMVASQALGDLKSLAVEIEANSPHMGELILADREDEVERLDVKCNPL